MTNVNAHRQSCKTQVINWRSYLNYLLSYVDKFYSPNEELFTYSITIVVLNMNMYILLFCCFCLLVVGSGIMGVEGWERWGGVKVGFNGLSVQILFWYHALSRNFIFCLFLMDLLFQLVVFRIFIVVTVVKLRQI